MYLCGAPAGYQVCGPLNEGSSFLTGTPSQCSALSEATLREDWSAYTCANGFKLSTYVKYGCDGAKLFLPETPPSDCPCDGGCGTVGCGGGGVGGGKCAMFQLHEV